METITTYGVGPDQPTYAQLREQNRVLRQFASTAVERWRAQTNVKEGISFRMAMKALESALTATSQEGQG